jgi:molybdate transport system ATP-binding protein
VAQLAGFENIFDATVWLIHEDRGTLTCRLPTEHPEVFVLLETPMIRAAQGLRVRVGIRAGDILLATVAPQGLSARNVIAGEIVSLEKRDRMISARVNCGVEMEVHLTLASRDALQLEPRRKVWLVIKTYSCHLMQR